MFSEWLVTGVAQGYIHRSGVQRFVSFFEFIVFLAGVEIGKIVWWQKFLYLLSFFYATVYLLLIIVLKCLFFDFSDLFDEINSTICLKILKWLFWLIGPSLSKIEWSEFIFQHRYHLFFWLGLLLGFMIAYFSHEIGDSLEAWLTFIMRHFFIIQYFRDDLQRFV